MRGSVSINGKQHEADVNGDKVLIDGQEFKVNLQKRGDEYLASVDEMQFGVRVEDGRALVDGVPIELVIGTGSGSSNNARPAAAQAPATGQAKKQSGEMVAGAVTAPMPGKIISIMAKLGDSVIQGDPLLLLEAMKMQNEVSSPFAGRVKEIRVREGESVDAHDVLIVIG
jgi:glutaconyl-CoA decarboxylase